MRVHGDGPAGALLKRDFGGFWGSSFVSLLLQDRLAVSPLVSYLSGTRLKRQTLACIFGCRRGDSDRAREHRTATRMSRRRIQSRCRGGGLTFQSAKAVSQHAILKRGGESLQYLLAFFRDTLCSDSRRHAGSRADWYTYEQ